MGKPTSAAWVAALVAVAASGCGGPDYADGAGFSDGFVAGYAQHCVMRAPSAQRRWSGPAYSRGFADGMARGIAACEEQSGEPVEAYASTQR
jgi:hypothetical protein